MSLPQTDSHAATTSKHPLFAILTVAGMFAIFILIYWISHRPVQPLSTSSGAAEGDAWRFSSEGRGGKLAEIRAKEHSASTSYGWVDQGKGVVRLPIDRAMELTVQELSSPAKKR